MKRNVSPGTGLALLACAIMVHAVIDRDASRADAGMPAHARAPAAAAWAAGPIEPTIVWYGASTYTDNYSFQRPIAIRAWSDGRVTEQGHLERPQLLIEDSIPTHLCLATGDGPAGWEAMRTTAMTRTWNVVIPLGSPY